MHRHRISVSKLSWVENISEKGRLENKSRAAVNSHCTGHLGEQGWCHTKLPCDQCEGDELLQPPS